MARARRDTLGLALAVGLLLAGQGCLFAGSQAHDEPEAPPPRPALTHEQQGSNDLLDRLAKDYKVRRDQELFLAEQHFETGRTHFELRNWKRAKDHFWRSTPSTPGRATTCARPARCSGWSRGSSAR